MSYARNMSSWCKAASANTGSRKPTSAETRGSRRRAYTPATQTNDGSVLQALFSTLPKSK